MVTREHLIFADGEYPAGTACEAASPAAAAEMLLRVGPITRLGIEAGDLRVVRLGGELRIVPAWAVQLPAAGSSEAA